MALGSVPSIAALAGLVGCASAAPVQHGGPLWPNVCADGDATSELGFCDRRLSLDERAADLVGRLTLQEKQSILTNTAAAVPRVGLPAYQWWSEGLHGPLEPCVTVGTETRCPTNFPAASAMASALNDTLYLAMGSAVGVEGRAISNTRDHNMAIGDGLTYWAPNANMERDPRWGRNQEAPGEDPHLTSKYIANYVRGLQEGEDPDHVQMVATCKHFLANELEHSIIDGTAVTRHNFDAEIPLPELVDYYLPAFRSCVQEGRALGIMCSYNAVNGIPMCANRDLLTDVLRDQWGFDGYVTSDCGAIVDVFAQHRFARDCVDATAQSLRAGCDTDCGGCYPRGTVAAVNRSMLSEETVDLAIKRLAKIQMRLGLFEKKEEQIYFDGTKYGINQIDTPEHQQLALEAALQSVVLLKNDGAEKVLPLSKGKKLAVVGPHTNGREVLMSNYHGDRCPDKKFGCITSPLEAIAKANSGGSTVGVQGVDVNSTADNISQAVEAAKAADAVVLLMGIDSSLEREELDRVDCQLPGNQPKLVQAISALKKPTVMVLIHGGAMCLGALKDSVPAIVDAFYGGERGAEALAAVLFGDYNPSGKLPVTMYPPEYMQQIPITQMSVTAPPGRTHLYYTQTPEFAFGTGLSYSKWEHNVVTSDSDISDGYASFSVRLENRGPVAGRQRILAFARPRSPSPGGLRQRLWGYQGVELAVGESQRLDFILKTADLAVSDSQGNLAVSPGDWDVVFMHGDGSEVAATVTVSTHTLVERSIFQKFQAAERSFVV